MTSSKVYLPFPLFLAIAGIVGLGFYYAVKIGAPTPQSIGINEITLAGSTTLEASPAPTSQTIGQEFTLDINARSGTDFVNLVKLDLTYDPTKLEIKSFTKTDYLPVISEATVIANGHVKAIFTVPEVEIGKDNWGTVGKLVIKPLKTGKHSIEFGDATMVATSGFPTNALKSVTPIEINVFHVGDIDKNKGVWLTDYNLFVKDFGMSGYSPADLDKSGQVNINDYKLFADNYGKVSQ